MYYCERCGYSTKIKCNFIKHQNRKVPCTINQKNSTQNIAIDARNIAVSTQNIAVDAQNVATNTQNIAIDAQNIAVSTQNIAIDNDTVQFELINDNTVQCKLCCKILLKVNFNRHFKVCRKVPKNACKYCEKQFNTPSVMCRHQKICKRNPMNMDDDDNVTERSLLDNQVSEPTIINNSNHSNNTTNSNTDNSQIHNTNNSHNTNNNINIKVENNNNFAYNYLGNEDVSYIANKPNVLQTLKSYGKKGIYGIGDIINSIICNPEHPENSTLLKPKEYGTDVLVRDCNDSNKLEFRDISDAIETIKNKALPRYLQGVCDYIKNNNITRLPDLKEKGLLRKLIHIMIVLDIDVPEELENIVDIDDDKVDQDRSNEALCNSHNSKLNKSVARSAYEFTKKNYKRKNGTYVMNI